MMNEHKNNNDDDDDRPQLSAGTLKALEEWRQEQEQNRVADVKEEDWQLSQFWYNQETAQRLVDEILNILPSNGKCAFIACPTAWKYLRQKHPEIVNILFEYDTRFDTGDQSFVEYDYNDDDLQGKYSSMIDTFDVLLIDPPFLSRECFAKVAQLVKMIGKKSPPCKHIICTGAVQEENIKEFFPGAQRVAFEPRHERNLMNPFACFVDYPTMTLNNE